MGGTEREGFCGTGNNVNNECLGEQRVIVRLGRMGRVEGAKVNWGRDIWEAAAPPRQIDYVEESLESKGGNGLGMVTNGAHRCPGRRRQSPLNRSTALK